MSTRRALLPAAVLSALFAAGAADAASSLKITKNGTTTTYAAPTATFTAYGNSQSLTLLVESGSAWYYLDLAAPRGQTLTRGVYSKAERAAFRTGRAPGLDLSGNGSGCNEVWGSFTIRQIGFGSDGKLNLLDATIAHQCETSTAPRTTAVVLFNAEPWSFSYKSPAGDFLGQGLTHTFLGHSSDFALTGTRSSMNFVASGDREDWSVRLAAPTGGQFAVGTYPTARFAGAGVAGLDISGNGRGCNTSSGSVTIRDLRTNEAGQVTGLYATYSQTCQGSTAPMTGTIRWFR